MSGSPALAHPLAIDTVDRRLANGLVAAVVPRPALHTATIVVAVRVGSRHEDERSNGISHFLEHMLFRGTPAHPTAYEFNLAVERLGGTLEAATRADFTTYELTLPPEHVDEGIALVAEIFFAPALRNLELEKKIVREEILESVDEDGRDIDADDLAHRALFGDHPLGFKIAGSAESLGRFDETSLRAWHAQHYVARNATVAVAGAIEAEATLSAIERAFGTLPEGTAQRPPPLTRPQSGPRFEYIESSGSQTDVRVILPAPGDRDPLHAATQVLGRILDDGMSTRLFRIVVEDTGLAYETFGGYDAYEDVGVFTVGASIEHAKTPALVRTVLELLVALRSNPIDPGELAKAKLRASFELRAMLDDARSIAEFVAIDRLFEQRRTLVEIAERIEAVTAHDLTTAARATIRPESLHVVAVGTLTEGTERETKRVVSAFATPAS